MVTAVRITLAGGDVDFYKQEIEDIAVQPDQDFQAQGNQSGAPIVYTAGEIFTAYVIDFIEFWKTTKAKIDQIIDEKAVMTLYYQYAYAPATSVSVVLYSGERTKRYSFGARRALVRHRLTFLGI